MKKFCAKCGKIVDKLSYGFCKNCYKKELEQKLPKIIEVAICEKCKMVIKGNDTQLPKVFFSKLAKKLDAKLIAANEKLKIQKEGFEFSLPIKRNYKLCRYCLLQKQGYYNAKIQIRFKANHQEILKLVEKKSQKERKRDKFAFITKIEKNNGLDIFIGSKSFAHKIALQIKRKYRVKMKISKKLITVKGGKRLYRDTIALVEK